MEVGDWIIRYSELLTRRTARQTQNDHPHLHGDGRESHKTRCCGIMRRSLILWLFQVVGSAARLVCQHRRVALLGCSAWATFTDEIPPHAYLSIPNAERSHIWRVVTHEALRQAQDKLRGVRVCATYYEA